MTQNFDPQFFDELASAAPTPGGGGAASVCAALASALSQMVVNLTVGKPKYAQVEERMKQELDYLSQLQQEFLQGIQEDAQAFQVLCSAYGLPKTSEADKEAREKAVQSGLLQAAQPPLKLMRLIVDLLPHIDFIAHEGSVLVRSDAGVAALCARAALESAAINVQVNACLLQNERDKQELLSQVDELVSHKGNATKIADFVQEGILNA